MTSTQVFAAVEARYMTPEHGAEVLMRARLRRGRLGRWLRALLTQVRDVLEECAR